MRAGFQKRTRQKMTICCQVNDQKVTGQNKQTTHDISFNGANNHSLADDRANSRSICTGWTGYEINRQRMG